MTKLSKQRKHLAELAKNRKQRIQKKSFRATGKQRRARSKTLRKIKLFFRKGENNFECPDNLIGSSQFHDFMRREWTVEKAHDHIRSAGSRVTGNIGEAVACLEFGEGVSHLFTRCFRFWFLCATPDRILFEPNHPTLLEIKSHESVQAAIQMRRRLPDRYLV